MTAIRDILKCVDKVDRNPGKSSIIINLMLAFENSAPID